MKTNAGNFFEDFRLGQKLLHATPRTLTVGDASLYTALYGSRFALQSSDVFAQRLGYARSPLDDLLVFHAVFGKSVPDISLNAVANLGYAEGRFLKPVFPGETLSAHSEVIGLKENSNRQTGIVYVRTHGLNQQNDDPVVTYVRWVQEMATAHWRFRASEEAQSRWAWVIVTRVPSSAADIAIRTSAALSTRANGLPSSSCRHTASSAGWECAIA